MRGEEVAEDSPADESRKLAALEGNAKWSHDKYTEGPARRTRGVRSTPEESGTKLCAYSSLLTLASSRVLKCNLIIVGATKLTEGLKLCDIILVTPLNLEISLSGAFAELNLHLGRVAQSGIICQPAVHPNCASHRVGNAVKALKLHYKIDGLPSILSQSEYEHQQNKADLIILYSGSPAPHSVKFCFVQTEEELVRAKAAYPCLQADQQPGLQGDGR